MKTPALNHVHPLASLDLSKEGAGTEKQCEHAYAKKDEYWFCCKRCGTLKPRRE